MPGGFPPGKIGFYPEQRLHPQPLQEPELLAPPTLPHAPHEPQPHRRQQPQPHPQELPQLLLLLLPFPVDVPPTVPPDGVQVQVHVQLGLLVDVPPTEPVVCLQQGLQQRCWTKSGNVIVPRTFPQLLHEEHICNTSIKNVRERLLPEHSMPHVRGLCQVLSFFACTGGTGASHSSCGFASGVCGFFMVSPRR